MHWFLAAIGGLFVVLALLMLVLELLAERAKLPDERSWSTALERIGRETGGLAGGGVLMIVLAIFMVEPITGFRLFLLPVGTVAAAAPLVHLVASWRAARDDSSASAFWRILADRSGRVMTGCCYLAAIGLVLFSLVTTDAKLDELAERIRTLETTHQPGE